VEVGAWWVRYRGLGLWCHRPRCAVGTCSFCDWNREESEVKIPSLTIGNSAPGEGQRREVPKGLAKLPTVAELLVQDAWEGGEEKGERAVFVFVSPTLLKLLVKIANPPLKLMVSGRSWDEAWQALEVTLRGSDVPWEQDQPREQGGKKKKK